MFIGDGDGGNGEEEGGNGHPKQNCPRRVVVVQQEALRIGGDARLALEVDLAHAHTRLLGGQRRCGPVERTKGQRGQYAEGTVR